MNTRHNFVFNVTTDHIYIHNWFEWNNGETYDLLILPEKFKAGFWKVQGLHYTLEPV